MWEPSSLTRYQTYIPCTGRTESSPLDCQGRPKLHCHLGPSLKSHRSHSCRTLLLKETRKPYRFKEREHRPLPLNGRNFKGFWNHVWKPSNFVLMAYLSCTFLLFSLRTSFVVSLRPRVGWEIGDEEYLLWFMMSSSKYFIHAMSPFHSLTGWMFWNSKARKRQKEHCLLLLQYFPEVESLTDKPNY